VDDAGLYVAFEAYTPVADPQAPFVGVRQLDDIPGRRIAGQPVQSADDAALDWRVEALKSRPARAEKTQPPSLKRSHA
jgi:hypothetical protein